MSLEDFIKEVFHSIVLRIDIKDDEVPFMSHWIYRGKHDFIKPFFLNETENAFFEAKNGGEPFSINDLIKIFFKLIKNKWDLLSLYQCEKWEYTQNFLLPQKVDIKTFKDNPDTCIPLKKLFFLGGKTNISEAIDKANKRDDGLHNLLDNISTESTKAFQKAWMD